MGENDLNGLIILDKPVDLSSARVVSIVKKLIGSKKAGHTGTLDPFATGVMICCLNRATKLSRFFIEGWKTYIAVMCLGIDTETQDITGAVIHKSEPVDFPENMIRSIIKDFEGKYEQVPPVYSALKHKGVPLYTLARRGQPVQKPARSVTISSIQVLDIQTPLVRFEVTCSSGTYVRALCADIGKMLGCGACLKELRRTTCSGFGIDDAVTLAELESYVAMDRVSECIVPMSRALKGMSKYIADNGLIKKLMKGNKINHEDIHTAFINDSGGFIKVVDKKDTLLAVLACSEKTGTYQYIANFTV